MHLVVRFHQEYVFPFFERRRFWLRRAGSANSGFVRDFVTDQAARLVDMRGMSRFSGLREIATGPDSHDFREVRGRNVERFSFRANSI